MSEKTVSNVTPMEARAYHEMADAAPLLRLYWIFDKKAEAFKSPLFAQTDGIAMRMVMNAISEGAGDLSRYPDDFALYWAAEANEHTGEVTPTGPAHVVECRVLANNLLRLRDEALAQEDEAAMKQDEVLDGTE